MVGERRESNAPSMGDMYMPPSYDEVKGNGVSRNAPANSESKPAKSLYFLAEVLLYCYKFIEHHSARCGLIL